MKDIRVVDGHHFVAANFNSQLLHDGATQVLNHSPVDFFAIQRDREGQSRGHGVSHVMRTKVGEPESSVWFWLMLLGLLVMTTDCRTPLTPKGLRSDLYGLSLRPNLLEAMMY